MSNLADNTEYAAINRIMAERRASMARAKKGYLEMHRNMEEGNETADRMSDLIFAVLALQPHEINMLSGLAKGLWEGESDERRAFCANIQAMLDAVPSD